MSEELKNRKPDVHTLAWWEERFQEVLKGYRGATHAMNKVLAANEDVARLNTEIQTTLLDRIQAQAEEIKADRAKIGELQARVERMAEFLGKLKKNGGENLTPATKRD